MIVGGLILGAAVLVAVLLSLGGSSKHGGSGSTAAVTSSSGAGGGSGQTKTSNAGSSSTTAAATVNPANANVAVLNGTGTTGLAHRVSAELAHRGYSRATALDGRPPGANQVTVVEYASGHRADAQSVARALGVTQPQPMESTVSSLAGSATVVVIVGLDKAATVP
jgi:LytR cell envelope-related transcriptional attenuator